MVLDNITHKVLMNKEVWVGFPWMSVLVDMWFPWMVNERLMDVVLMDSIREAHRCVSHRWHTRGPWMKWL